MSGIRLLNDQNYSVIVDAYSTSETFVGKSLPGAQKSDNVWQVFKVYTSGTVTQVLFADGNKNYDNVWDNRLSLTYE